MSETEPQTQPLRERLKSQSGRKPRSPVTKTPKAPSPTRPIEPGAIHFQIAEGILRKVRASMEAKTGQSFDVGDFPSVEETITEDDPQLAVKHTAHAVARLGDRFSFLRKISRHFEGSDRRTGILGDLLAVAVALYKRNPETFGSLAQQFGSELQERRAAARANHNGGTVGNVSSVGSPQPQKEGAQ